MWGSTSQQSPYTQPKQKNVQDIGDMKIGELVSRMNFVKREKTEHEQYLDQKAAEVAQVSFCQFCSLQQYYYSLKKLICKQVFMEDGLWKTARKV